jgi:hypothetical protein
MSAHEAVAKTVYGTIKLSVIDKDSDGAGGEDLEEGIEAPPRNGRGGESPRETGLKAELCRISSEGWMNDGKVRSELRFG